MPSIAPDALAQLDTPTAIASKLPGTNTTTQSQETPKHTFATTMHVAEALSPGPPLTHRGDEAKLYLPSIVNCVKRERPGMKATVVCSKICACIYMLYMYDMYTCAQM